MNASPNGREGPARFHLRGEIDMSNCDSAFDELLVGRNTDGATPALVIDCSELEFIDSSGLNMLVRLKRETGAEIVLLAVPAECRRVFEVTQLDEVFEMRDALPTDPFADRRHPSSGPP